MDLGDTSKLDTPSETERRTAPRSPNMRPSSAYHKRGDRVNTHSTRVATETTAKRRRKSCCSDFAHIPTHYSRKSYSRKSLGAKIDKWRRHACHSCVSVCVKYSC